MREFEKYIGSPDTGVNLSISYDDKKKQYKVFTIPTQHFHVYCLSELTPYRFELEAKLTRDEA